MGDYFKPGEHGMIGASAYDREPRMPKPPDTRVESQPENSGWTSSPPRLLPPRFSAPIRPSAVLTSPLTSTPTSKRPGDISMLTEPDTSRSSRCQCSSDSLPLINTSNSSNQSEWT